MKKFIVLSVVFFSCSNHQPLNEKKGKPDSIVSKTGELILSKQEYKNESEIIVSSDNFKDLVNLLNESKCDSFSKFDSCPTNIKKFIFDNCYNSKFGIAGINQNWQSTDIHIDRLPIRQLKELLVCENVVLLYYLKGGVGVSLNVLLFKLKKDKIIEFWHGVILTEFENRTAMLNYIKDNLKNATIFSELHL